MPDSWEYPWYASWDLAFHAVALAHLDPSYAKSQLLLLCREWYMHPNGQLPAYEWDFGDVNPPVQAWAAMAVWRIDTAPQALHGLPPDNDFLERVFHKLLINFTWWVNRKGRRGEQRLRGGLPGARQHRAFRPVPTAAGPRRPRAVRRYGVDGDVLHLAAGNGAAAGRHDPTYEDIAIKFYEHFAYIASAMQSQGLWDVDDGFFYDVIKFPDGDSVPVKARSIVGVVPLLAVTTLHPELAAKLPDFMQRTEWFELNRPKLAAYIAHTRVPGMGDRLLLSVANQRSPAAGPQTCPRPGRDAVSVRHP